MALHKGVKRPGCEGEGRRILESEDAGGAGSTVDDRHFADDIAGTVLGDHEAPPFGAGFFDPNAALRDDKEPDTFVSLLDELLAF